MKKKYLKPEIEYAHYETIGFITSSTDWNIFDGENNGKPKDIDPGTGHDPDADNAKAFNGFEDLWGDDL